MVRKAPPPSAFRFDRGAPTHESYRFLAENPATIAVAAEGAKRKFEGVAYSGDKIANHFYWGDVVFDLSTTKAPQKLPMLLGHDNDKVVGFSNSIDIGGDIKVAGMLSGVTEEGKQVAALSDEGFPWQMSVRIEPLRIDEISAGQKVTVNGREFAGPITVFRNSTIREISFTPTGWDAQTSAVAMAHGNSSEDTTMTPEQIKALQDQAAKFEADAKAEKTAREKAQADAAASDAKVKVFEKEKTDAALAKRETDIKSLFTATGIAFSDAAATPYRTMDEDTFAAVATQMKDTVKKVDPKLFQEQATNGATGGAANDAVALSAKANELIFAAKQRGVTLDVVDAVKQAKTLLSAAA